MKYKFLGKPDYKFPDLKTGGVYDLTVRELDCLDSFFRGFKIEIVSPFYCPYRDRFSFEENWEKLNSTLVKKDL